MRSCKDHGNLRRDQPPQFPLGAVPRSRFPLLSRRQRCLVQGWWRYRDGMYVTWPKVHLLRPTRNSEGSQNQRLGKQGSVASTRWPQRRRPVSQCFHISRRIDAPCQCDPCSSRARNQPAPERNGKAKQYGMIERCRRNDALGEGLIALLRTFLKCSRHANDEGRAQGELYPTSLSGTASRAL